MPQPAHPPLDPAIERRVRERSAQIGFVQTLGIVVEELREGYCRMRLPFREALGQEHGYVHGGVVGALLDSAAGHAVQTVMRPGEDSVTAEYKLNFLAPAKGAHVIGHGDVIRAGGHLIVCRCDAYVPDGDAERHVATALVTYIRLRQR